MFYRGTEVYGTPVPALMLRSVKKQCRGWAGVGPSVAVGGGLGGPGAVPSGGGGGVVARDPRAYSDNALWPRRNFYIGRFG